MEVNEVEFGKVKYHVLDVAAYCLQNYDFNSFKLQKVLYYIQAAFLVKKKEPCFMGRIVKAEFGPIIPTIANIYSVFGFGNQIIRLDKDRVIGNSSLIEKCDSDKELIDKVCEKSKNMSGNELSIRTHQDDPWIKAVMDDTISCLSISDYYNANQDRLLL